MTVDDLGFERCPFCGCYPTHAPQYDNRADEEPPRVPKFAAWHVWCDTCRSHGPAVESAEAAKEAWNRLARQRGAIQATGDSIMKNQHRKIAMLRYCLMAIRARIVGVFDHPALEAYGPLGDMKEDCCSLVENGLAGDPNGAWYPILDENHLRVVANLTEIAASQQDERPQL